MSCPNCTHTMTNLGVARNQPIFYCARCGTIKDSIATETPFVINYLRAFVARLFHHEVRLKDGHQIVDELIKSGLLECAYKPEERPAAEKD